MLKDRSLKVISLNPADGKIVLLGVRAAQHTGKILASHPEAPGLILGVPKNFSLDVDEIQ